MTTWRRARVGVGALMIGVPSFAGALATGQALAAPAEQPTHTTSPELAARVQIHSRRIAVRGGQAVQVRGRLLSGLAGRKVSLQGRQDGRWQTLTSTRTRVAGRFMLRYVAHSAGQEPIRVASARERLSAPVGQMTVYRQAGASWYNDGGTTACGFHAEYGVANQTLPCGTKVALRYNGRSVTATVDDRGPYVGGRDWDLNQNTAAALGFGGIGTVWSSQ